MEFTKSDIKSIADSLLSKLKIGNSATLVALSGDLGAGKTTFTQEIANILDIKESIISPTFVIMKIYDIPNSKNWKKLIHIDAYRLNKEEEMLKLGWSELMKDPSNLILVEWPENIKGLIPQDAINISLSHIDENTRHIDISLQ